MGITPNAWAELRPLKGQEPRDPDLPVKLVLGAALAAASFIGGWFMGFDHANDQLPKCEEDELLTFKDDFPYDNTADLVCIHIDEVHP